MVLDDITSRSPGVCPDCGLPLCSGRLASRCPNCLFQLALGTGSRDAASPPPSAERGAPGALGKYELLHEIAHGSMGRVYKARQQGLNRLVALKRILSDTIASPEVVLRFQLEAEAIASLDHPNIVPVYETGQAGGIHFFTMKLVEGGSLADLVHAAADLPSKDQIRRRAGILLKVCEAVHHAHSRGVLHRDLKPTNILLDSAGEPHVSDFGLAKILERDSDVTSSGSVLGSPAYIAPEVAAGGGSAATTAADVYGLGALLFTMLTGRPPFRGGTAVETLRRVIDDPPPSPRAVNPAVDRDLEMLCLSCLEKDPQRRCGSARELAADLERWLAGEPVRARPAPALFQAVRWMRRNPALAAACLATLGLLAALALGSSIAALRIARANERAESLLTQMPLAQAEQWLAAGQSSDGLAMLAHVSAKLPDDLLTSRRLLSALGHRGYALQAGQPVRHGAPILAAHTVAGNGQIVTVGEDGAIRRWQVSSDQAVSSFPLPGARPLQAEFSGDGRFLTVLTGDRTVELWRVNEPPVRALKLSPPGPHPPRGAYPDQRGNRVAVVAESVISLWETGEGAWQRDLIHPSDISSRVARGAAGGDRVARRIGPNLGRGKRRAIRPSAAA